MVCAATDYLEANGLAGKMANATHILWSTGGNMVPADEKQHYYEKGKQ